MLLGFDNERNANEQTLVKEKQLEAEFGDTIQVLRTTSVQSF